MSAAWKRTGSGGVASTLKVTMTFLSSSVPPHRPREPSRGRGACVGSGRGLVRRGATRVLHSRGARDGFARGCTTKPKLGNFNLPPPGAGGHSGLRAAGEGQRRGCATHAAWRCWPSPQGRVCDNERAARGPLHSGRRQRSLQPRSSPPVWSPVAWVRASREGGNRGPRAEPSPSDGGGGTVRCRRHPTLFPFFLCVCACVCGLHLTSHVLGAAAGLRPVCPARRESRTAVAVGAVGSRTM